MLVLHLNLWEREPNAIGTTTYVTEDETMAYVTEDGLTPYVTEAA